ncbi:hypothetical protein IWQ62_002197 [Dispira parvispora]|uniref:N-acetyltransferase ECO1 n=1 Tax=Dispira parvispora TaxID=1520584 RepID=A0A9W8AQI8_9FUNG|nr:hypothetical protein IWQ62_002197 [Dispira parvispora]
MRNLSVDYNSPTTLVRETTGYTKSPVKVTYQRRKRRLPLEEPPTPTRATRYKSVPHTSLASTVSRSCPSTPQTKKLRPITPATVSSQLRVDKNLKQLYLDLGQKSLGPSHCTTCGLSYQCGQPEDERVHERYHRSVTRGIKYPGYKTEVIVKAFVPVNNPQPTTKTTLPTLTSFLKMKPDHHGSSGGPRLGKGITEHTTSSRVVVIDQQSSVFEKNKAKEVLEVVNAELGSTAFQDEAWSHCKVYLCVSSTNLVLGCAVAESIRLAYPAQFEGGASLPSPCPTVSSDSNRASSPVSPPSSPLRGYSDPTNVTPLDLPKESPSEPRIQFCPENLVLSPIPVQATCGISRVWVAPRFRQRNIAGHLLDAVCQSFVYGLTIPRRELAFSQPTTQGILLAKSFTKRPDFLVYIESDHR